MSRNYKFYNLEGLYFVSFAVVAWLDVFTRNLYKDILIDSLTFCQKNHTKGFVRELGKCVVEGKGVVTELQDVINKLPKELAGDLVDYINGSKDILKLFKEIETSKLDELIKSFRLYRKHNIEIPTCK